MTVKSNGFQDRLVMTASIPLQLNVFVLCDSAFILYHGRTRMSSVFCVKKHKNIAVNFVYYDSF